MIKLLELRETKRELCSQETSKIENCELRRKLFEERFKDNPLFRGDYTLFVLWCQENHLRAGELGKIKMRIYNLK